MPRVKRGVTARARHKKVLDLAKGFRGRRGNVYRDDRGNLWRDLELFYGGREPLHHV